MATNKTTMVKRREACISYKDIATMFIATEFSKQATYSTKELVFTEDDVRDYLNLHYADNLLRKDVASGMKVHSAKALYAMKNATVLALRKRGVKFNRTSRKLALDIGIAAAVYAEAMKDVKLTEELNKQELHSKH